MKESVKASVKACPNMHKYSPNSWGTNPAGYYEAGCAACRKAGETCLIEKNN